MGETLNQSNSFDIHIVIMSKMFVLLLLGLVLTNTTAQPKNVEAKAEGECRYEQALACAVEMEDLILDCIRQDMDHIPGCVVDGLGGIDGGNPCVWCVCTVLQMVGLSC